MNNDNLERILEEAFQSVLQTSFPEAGNVLSRIEQELTRTDSAGGQTTEEETQVDISFNSVPVQDTTTQTTQTNTQSANSVPRPNSVPQNAANRAQRTLHTQYSNTHIVDVTHHLYLNYQENMRLYQHNMSLMLRHLQTVNRSQTTTNSVGSTRQRQRTRIPPLFSNGNENLSFEIQTFPFYGVFPSSSGEPLHSIPTIQQFTNAIETCTYTEEEFSSTRTCSITLDDFQEQEQIYRIKHCRHVFKIPALQNWFSRNSHCPVCRYDIRTYEEHPSSNPLVRTNSRSNSL